MAARYALLQGMHRHQAYHSVRLASASQAKADEARAEQRRRARLRGFQVAGEDESHLGWMTGPRIAEKASGCCFAGAIAAVTPPGVVYERHKGIRRSRC